MNPESNLDATNADRLILLDRIADRVPELDLDEHETEWLTLPDGAEALLVNGGGIDGSDGTYFANAGLDFGKASPPCARALTCGISGG